MLKLGYTNKTFKKLLEIDYEPLLDVTDLMESYTLPNENLELFISNPISYDTSMRNCSINYSLEYKGVPILSPCLLHLLCEEPVYPIRITTLLNPINYLNAINNKIDNLDKLNEYFETVVDPMMHNLLQAKFSYITTLQEYMNIYDYVETTCKKEWKYKAGCGFFHYPKKSAIIKDIQFVKSYNSVVAVTLKNDHYVRVNISKDIKQKLMELCKK